MSHPYFPHTEEDIKEMLNTIGVDNLSSLFSDIPQNIKLNKNLNLPSSLSEYELVKEMKKIAKKNEINYISFLGAGAYNHFIPSIVKHITSRSEFYTAYTPYQPEASQGILQVFYEYQSLICELTGMEVANASMYDGSTSALEAVYMAHRINERDKVLIASTIHPEYKEVLKTYTKNSNIKIEEIKRNGATIEVYDLKEKLNETISSVVIQHPNFFGYLENMEEISKIVKGIHDVLLIMIVNPISLAILTPPGEYDADVAVGEGQPLGIPLSFGGPYIGFFASKMKYIRKMPGRIIGETVDTNGNRGFVMTLQPREQHIRREKATSNICTNEALCALANCVYISTLGKNGLRKVAEVSIQNAHYFSNRLKEIGCELISHEPFFHEFAFKCNIEPQKLNKELLKHKIIGGLELGKFFPELHEYMLVCTTEVIQKKDIDTFIDVIKELKK